MDWQPIEIAPKDETTVDVWVQGPVHGYRVASIWWCPRENGWYDPDACYGDGGLAELSEGHAFTHWMPLPPAPAPL